MNKKHSIAIGIVSSLILVAAVDYLYRYLKVKNLALLIFEEGVVTRLVPQNTLIEECEELDQSGVKFSVYVFDNDKLKLKLQKRGIRVTENIDPYWF